MRRHIIALTLTFLCLAAVSEAEGRVCAAPSVSCPPAIPIAVSGEIITAGHIRLFEYYGIEKIAVMKDN